MEAIILAGGKGTRLKSVVADVPKPMAPIAGRPFLCYLLDNLSDANFDRVILSVGYKREVIQKYFGSLYGKMRLEYYAEETPLGTGGAIKAALGRCNDDIVFVLNGDTLFQVDYAAMRRLHVAGQAPLTMAVKELTDFDRYGSLAIEDGRITEFREKAFTERGFINGGIYLMARDLLHDAPEGNFSLEQDFLMRRAVPMNAFLSEGYFLDIGIPEDYRRAQRELPTLRRGG